MATITGASVTITATDDTLRSQLQQLADNIDTTPLMHQLGTYFQASTRERFKTLTDPQGQRWAPLSPGYFKRKKNNQSLILTLRGKLVGLIRYQPLSPTSVAWGSDRPYAAIHNLGGDGTGRNGNMPQRQFLGVSNADNAEALEIVQDWVHRRIHGLPD